MNFGKTPGVKYRDIAGALAFSVTWGGSSPVWADDSPTAVSIDVTDSSSVIYNANNRNTRRADVASQADDEWGLWYNRLNLQSSSGRWRMGLRLDSALFFTSRSPTDMSLDLLRLEHGGRLPSDYDSEDAQFFVQKVQQAGDELSTRFVNWVYPAKLNATYSSPHFEATVGDSYAQFGRGLVLSLRKRDELSSDTTLRGARLSGTLRTSGMRVKLTGLGGTLNPLRIDEASGRALGTTSEVTRGIARITEFGMPKVSETEYRPNPPPNFAPDTLTGLQLETATDKVGVALQGVRLSRGCIDTPSGCRTLGTHVARDARLVETGGVSVNFPDLWSHAAAYVEYAHQRLSERSGDAAPAQGDALYANVNIDTGPLTVTMEGKHYRNFFPLYGNVDIRHGREFAPLQYSAPPTTEAVWNDTQFEGFNTCVTGGRTKVDYLITRQHTIYAWVGRYNTWAESAAAGLCEAVSENLNRVWDFAQGVELSSKDHNTWVNIHVGTRFDTTDRKLLDTAGGLTDVFYTEGYLRYDAVHAIDEFVSIQFQGWHRRRHQTLGGPPAPWLQGQTVNALQLGSHWSVGVGLEYDQNPAFPDTYVNGVARYNLNGGDNVSLFVGQRQGGLRCVSGICRIFPPFEGLRLDGTFRF